MKGGVEFISLLSLEACRCRLDFVARRRPDDLSRSGIQCHHADFPNHSIPRASQAGGDDPDLDVLQGQAAWHAPTDPHAVVPQAVRVGRDLYGLDFASALPPSLGRAL